LLIAHYEVLCQNLFISNYTQKEYGSLYTSSPQNWDIEQDSLGRLYIANSSGILLFDGLNWSMIQGTENKDLYSLSKARDGKIYVGGKNDLGHFSKDALGRAVFNSLLPLLNNNGISPGEIREVLANGSSVYFKNEDGVIALSGNKIAFHQIKSEYDGIQIVDGNLVVQDNHGNLLKLVKEKFDTLYSLNSELKSGIVSIIDIKGRDKLLFTSESGIFKISNGELSKWKSEVDDLLPKTKIEDVINYPKLNLVGIAIKGSGIQFIDYDGNVIKSLGTKQGLASNTCYNLFRDFNNELWACLDIGLSRIEYPSAQSFFDSSNGLNGVVNSTVEYKNRLYVGTTNGLFFLDEQDQFIKLPVIDEVWDLKLIDKTIWVAASSGIHIVKNEKVRRINDLDSRAIESTSSNDKLLVGLSDGIGILEKTKGSWRWKGKIEEVQHEVRTIALENDSVVWGSFEKVSRIVLSDDFSKATTVKTMDERNGFSEDFYITESYNIRNQVYFGTGIGLYRYDSDQEIFIIDSSFGSRFSDKLHDAWALAEDGNSNIWLTSNRTSGRLIFENNEVQLWDTLAFARLSFTDVWRIVPIIDQDRIYFCTTDGLFRFDLKMDKNYEINYATIINKIELNRDSVISYLAVDQSQHSPEKQISYSYNDLRFSFTAASFNYDEELQFSYFLEGYDDDWSAWVAEHFKDYTNLPFGNYTFKVKAKNLYGVEANTAKYAFDIMRPWYRSYWAYGVACALFIGGVIVIDRIQRKRLFKKQQKRIKVQQQKLERERQISNKLRKVDRLKDEFLANTSHELRTPLNGIIGISESLYEESQNIDEEEMKSNLAMVIASGKRLASLVDSILDYSKLKTENLEIRKRPVDLKSVVKIVLTMSRPLISRENLRLINNVPEDLPLVEADENRLQQILYNLVGNAIKFSEKGKISIDAILKEDYVEVTVSDEGVGIPEDKLEKVFDSYEQANVEINRDYLGTGLGLTISKKLVELHNGTIKAESKIGHGSKFIFTIPISLQNDPSWSKTEVSVIEEDNLAPKMREVQNTIFNILIVDDEPINRQVLINHLKNEPYYLEVASGGSEALDLIEKRKFDLVLLDVMMPKMSGFEVCMKIREKYMISELPVIFITAKGQIIDLVEGLKYGGNDYITKPFSKQEFLARIKTHLNLIKINDSYSRFIPYEFLHSLGRESIMDVNLGDQVEKDVTILFSDIRDYTTLSEKMTPKENFDFLNSFLNKMGPVIRENDGFVMQYLGDGLMSIFLNNPMDAVAASIEMLGQIEAYNLNRQSKLRTQISVGFGIHSGKLMMGVIGDEKRMDVNVVSDSVNTASRMEGLTKYYGASIIMSEDTLNGIDEMKDLHYRFLGLVKVKGKMNPLKIYEVLDGVTDKANELKIKTRDMFESGLEYYFNKDFINAATQFKQVVTENESDLSAQMYLKLSAKFMVENVPENWTGVETMILK
jgi:signal transduction histidine kinase/class 3 adenylate cyclase/ActR/RegA family two-component response regulator/ligand-binding sensor domain-containing protein